MTTMKASELRHIPFSADFQSIVKAELETLLKAPIFAQSSRCKSFLSHVVLQTLSGNAGELKERTIGISVFRRTNDYDTSDDSIVRVTANDVRKRLGQFYTETLGDRPIQIQLPRGSYVPEFRIQRLRGVKKADAGKDSDSMNGSLESAEMSASLEADFVSQPVAAPVTTPESTPIEAAPSAKSVARRFVRPVMVILPVIAATAILAVWRFGALNDIPDLWGSFLHANAPVLVCIDTHDLQVGANGQRFVDMVLRKQSIALDDAAVLSSVAAVLGKKDIPFRVVGAEQTSLADIRRQPTILIGAIDNRWTLRLSQNLRYRIEIANPPGSGSDREPIASIVDSEHPAGTRWTSDLSIPFAAWKTDYAVVARMDDATTGVPVLIEAGLGNDGTLAASELITSGAIPAILSREPACRGKKNFELVIETQIIDTKSGPPHVLRLICW